MATVSNRSAVVTVHIVDDSGTSSNESAQLPRITTAHTSRHKQWIEVTDFLKSIEFDDYIDIFEKEGYDRMAALFSLTMDDLRDMKIKRGHARIILQHIQIYMKQSKLSPKRVHFTGSNGNSTVSSANSEMEIIDNTSVQSMHYQPNNAGSYLPIVNENHRNSPNNNNSNINHNNNMNMNGNNDNNNQQQRYYNNNTNNNNNYRTAKLHLYDQSSASQQSHNMHNMNLHDYASHTSLLTPDDAAMNNVRSVSFSSRTMLVKSVSRDSHMTADTDYEHMHSLQSEQNYNANANTNNHMNLRRMPSGRSYRSSPANSMCMSDAGTVIIRPSVLSLEDRSSLSPAMSPVLHSTNDIHHDLNSLIDALRQVAPDNTDYDEFHEALVSVTSNWDRNKVSYELAQMLSAQPNDYVILDLMGVYHAQIGNTEIAIKHHTDAIENSDNTYIEAMHNYAYLCHRIGDNSSDNASISYYKKALNINPLFGHCWLHYGNLLEDHRKCTDALAMYKKAIHARPGNAAFHLDLANCLDDLNDFELASLHYMKCVELQPNDAVYHWNYAISLENQCMYYKAEDAYKRAINLDPNCVDAHTNYAHMLQNQPSPQYSRALSEYETVLRLTKDDTQAMLGCANLYDHFGSLSKAEHLYMRVLQIDPNYDDAYIGFSRYLMAQNRIEDANACYQAGIRCCSSTKIQEQYISFLKDINTVYNKASNGKKGGNNRGGISKIDMRKVNNNNNRNPSKPASPFVTNMTIKYGNDNNANQTPTTPDIYDDDLDFDYCRPASTKKPIKNTVTKSTNNNKNGNTEEQGCLIM